MPSDADILRCRQKTSGIQKIEFKVKVSKQKIDIFALFTLKTVNFVQATQLRKFAPSYFGVPYYSGANLNITFLISMKLCMYFILGAKINAWWNSGLLDV